MCTPVFNPAQHFSHPNGLGNQRGEMKPWLKGLARQNTIWTFFSPWLVCKDQNVSGIYKCGQICICIFSPLILVLLININYKKKIKEKREKLSPIRIYVKLTYDWPLFGRDWFRLLIYVPGGRTEMMIIALSWDQTTVHESPAETFNYFFAAT